MSHALLALGGRVFWGRRLGYDSCIRWEGLSGRPTSRAWGKMGLIVEVEKIYD
jgi:hypothetical protein